MKEPIFQGPDREWFCLWLLQWLGVPFADHGRDRGGVDCVGLVILAYQAAGLVPADFQCPQYALSGGRHLAISPMAGVLKDLGTFEPLWERDGNVGAQTLIPEFLGGDLITVRFGRVNWHMGIALGPTSFLHAHPRNGVERADVRDWTVRKLMTGLYRPMAEKGHHVWR